MPLDSQSRTHHRQTHSYTLFCKVSPNLLRTLFNLLTTVFLLLLFPHHPPPPPRYSEHRAAVYPSSCQTLGAHIASVPVPPERDRSLSRCKVSWLGAPLSLAACNQPTATPAIAPLQVRGGVGWGAEAPPLTCRERGGSEQQGSLEERSARRPGHGQRRPRRGSEAPERSAAAEAKRAALKFAGRCRQLGPDGLREPRGGL